MASRWPKDNQTALIKFYGDPGTGSVASQLVRLVPPFQMYFDKKPIDHMMVHQKCAAAFASALSKIWNYYGHDQKVIDKLHISWTSGTYAPRFVRGSSSKWSNHAYGAAWDVDAEDNPLGSTKNKLALPVVAAFKSEGASWGGDYKSRKDNMHLEFCDRGEPQRTFAEWLAFYKCPPMAASPPRTLPPPTLPPLQPPAPVSPQPPETTVQGDPELWNVQRRLKDMKYNPGGLDGVWGGLSAGAITGFLNDRQSKITPPTSLAAFHETLKDLNIEIGAAQSEHYTRPIAPERSQVTPADLAPKLPEVDASIKTERLTFWGSIAGGVSAVVTGISKFMGDAFEWLTKLKDIAGDLPWGVWVVGALIVSALLYYVSLKSGEAKDASTEAFRSGERA